MATLLAIDTSSEGCSVALSHDGSDSARYLDAPRQHTQSLLPMIDELLTANNLNLSDLDAIAYGRGPGSFTGLRICLSVAQGLAYASGLPLIGVSSLQTLMQQVRLERDVAVGDVILVAIDARMNEVYWCAYEVTKSGFRPMVEEQLSAPEAVADYVNQSADVLSALAMKVGSGCHYQAIESLAAQQTWLDIQPQAQYMLPLALSLHNDGESVAAECAEPIYLRDTVAWQKRQRIRR